MKYILPNFLRAIILSTSIVLFIAGFLAVTLLPNPAFAGDICDTITMETQSKHTPIPKSEIVSKRPVMNMCEVIFKIVSEFVPVYATDKFVLAGEMYSENKQITHETLDGLNAISEEQTKKGFLSLKSEPPPNFSQGEVQIWCYVECPP